MSKIGACAQVCQCCPPIKESLQGFTRFHTRVRVQLPLIVDAHWPVDKHARVTVPDQPPKQNWPATVVLAGVKLGQLALKSVLLLAQ